MLKIVDLSNRKAVSALLAPERTRDAATEKTVAAIVDGVRRGGDKALVRYARSLDGLAGTIGMTAAEMGRAANGACDVRTASRNAARNIRAVAKKQVPRGWRVRLAPGVTVDNGSSRSTASAATSPAAATRCRHRC